MRIISKSHDYYDSVMKTGMDRDVVYVREKKELEIDKKYKLGHSYTSHSSWHSVRLYLLGYCGQIFKIYEVEVKYLDHTDKKYFFHDPEEFKKFMLQNKFAKEYDFGGRRWWPGTYSEFREQDTKSLVELFHKHQVPLFLISSNKDDRKKHLLTLNPSLKALEFQRVKDPYTAFQDIFQFVAGILNKPENGMIKISDKIKAEKHGFDKWSFRKMPTKRK